MHSYIGIATGSERRTTVRRERPFDLHALSTPPAFILDQDQILKFCPLRRSEARRAQEHKPCAKCDWLPNLDPPKFLLRKNFGGSSILQPLGLRPRLALSGNIGTTIKFSTPFRNPPSDRNRSGGSHLGVAYF